MYLASNHLLNEHYGKSLDKDVVCKHFLPNIIYLIGIKTDIESTRGKTVK
jgi:hypothetical protein